MKLALERVRFLESTAKTTGRGVIIPDAVVLMGIYHEWLRELFENGRLPEGVGEEVRSEMERLKVTTGGTVRGREDDGEA